MVLAGDWNAVQQASDRQPSAHLNPMDKIFMTDLAAMGLQSVFALPDGSLPAASRMPSYERDCKQGKEASSRIDDFLCTRRCGLATAAATMEQPQVLTDNVFRTSDHRPILLQFKYGDVFASPPTQPPRRPPPRPALKKALTAEQMQR